jgi:hypothetical protein
MSGRKYDFSDVEELTAVLSAQHRSWLQRKSTMHF